MNPLAQHARQKKLSGINTIRRCTAFSLVEVTLALGVISFGMLALAGLLPVGLQSAKNASEAAGATNAVTRFSNAIRFAESQDGITYHARIGETLVEYVIGGPQVDVPVVDLTLSGVPTDDESEKRLRASIIIVPPERPGLPGNARVSVAWPSTSVVQAAEWTGHEGSLSTGVQFLPKP